MIKSKIFKCTGCSSLDDGYERIEESVNSYIIENNIEKSDILEYRTEDSYEYGYYSLKVVLTWWDNCSDSEYTYDDIEDKYDAFDAFIDDIIND